MGTATITLDDDEGQIAVKLVFSGGFDKASHAHQHAQILIALMDQHMQRNGAPVIDPLVIEAQPRFNTSGTDVVASLAAIKQAAALQG